MGGKSQTRPNIFPWYFTILGWTFPTFYIEFPTWNQYFGDKKNPKLGPTFSHDILQYWDKHSQLFMLNSQHKISILGTKKNTKLDPKFSHDIYQHWDENSQCMTSISQHPLWNCISQWNPKKLPSIPQHWETHSHDWVMNLGILRKFPIRELVIFSCEHGSIFWLSHTVIKAKFMPGVESTFWKDAGICSEIARLNTLISLVQLNINRYGYFLFFT